MEKKGKIILFIMGTIFLIVFFTSKLAKDIGYHKVMGNPVSVIKKIRIYVPNERILKDKNLKKTRAYKNNSVFLMFSIVGFAGLFIIKRKELTAYGTARWANKSEIRAMKLDNPSGVVLGESSGRILTHNGAEHLMMMAPTRSGKGINTVLPTLYTWQNSTIINDIKGECWRDTAGYRKEKFGHKCIYFNPLDDTGESAKYNPLDRIALRTKDELKDVKIIAQTLIDTEGKGEGDHWVTGAINILVGVILHVKYVKEDANMTDIIAFMTNPEKPFVEAMGDVLGYQDDGEGNMIQNLSAVHSHGSKKLFKKIYNKEVELHPEVGSSFSTLYKTPDKEQGSIISSCVSKLQIFKDPRVAEAVSRSDFSPKEIMKEKVSLYLVTPPEAIDMTRAIFRLILTQTIYGLTGVMKFELSDELTLVEKIEKYLILTFRKYFVKISEKNRILFLIDEFPALGKLELFEKAIAYIAGYGLKVLLITQSINQLRKIYGKDNSILDNCHVQMYMTPNDEETPKMISNMLGTYTERIKNRSNKIGEFVGGTVSETLVSRPLLTPGEVRTLSDTKLIIFVSGKKPIYADKIFYYKMRKYKNNKLPVPTKKDNLVGELTTLTPKITLQEAKRIIDKEGTEKIEEILKEIDIKKFNSETKNLQVINAEYFCSLGKEILKKKFLDKDDRNKYIELKQSVQGLNEIVFLELLQEYGVMNIEKRLGIVLKGDKNTIEKTANNYIEGKLKKEEVLNSFHLYEIICLCEGKMKKSIEKEEYELFTEEKIFIDGYNAEDKRITIVILGRVLTKYREKNIFEILKKIPSKELSTWTKEYDIVNEDVVYDVIAENILKEEKKRKLYQEEEELLKELFKNTSLIKTGSLRRPFMEEFLIYYDTQNVLERLTKVNKGDFIREVSLKPITKKGIYDVLKELTEEKPQEKKEEIKEGKKEILEKLKDHVRKEDYEKILELSGDDEIEIFLKREDIKELNIEEFLRMYIASNGVEKVLKIEIEDLKEELGQVVAIDYLTIEKILNTLINGKNKTMKL